MHAVVFWSIAPLLFFSPITDRLQKSTEETAGHVDDECCFVQYADAHTNITSHFYLYLPFVSVPLSGGDNLLFAPHQICWMDIHYIIEFISTFLYHILAQFVL